MRKDMRFAWAAGGLLVAVMAIYLIVAGTSGGNKNSQPVELVTDAPVQTPAKNATDVAAKAPAAQPRDAQAAASPAADDKPKADVWGVLLTTGRAPAGMLMTETPQAAPQVAPKVEAGVVTAQTPESSDVADAGDLPKAATPDAATPPTPASPALAATAANTAHPSSASGKHVVQAGETFSIIAQQAYGSAAYWGHIARANPNINPRHLKVGMVLTLPDAAQVTGSAHAPAKSADASKNIDPARQYTVQSNDSLYKISMKLYHSPKLVDKIYELNKQAIGPNPAHLKLNMVLELPQAPVQ